jgi:cephalosporin hydroxylase
MNGDNEFVRALSEFLAFHTEQPTSYFNVLINSFMRGAQGRPNLESSARDKLAKRLKVELEAYHDVPTFLQNYLLTHLAHGAWPPQAAFVASRYLARPSDERFMSWQRRQQLISELASEPIRGTELGFRQMLYSQGAGPVFSWRGIPCFKSSYDIALYAMLLHELRPRTVIELGSGAGGSSLLFADLCASMGLSTKIMSVDRAVADVSDPRIDFIQSDCSEWLAASAKSKREFERPCLIIEDFHGDLVDFFNSMDAILEDKDYLIVEDSLPKQNRIAELIASSPYLIDCKYTDFFGINCTSAINSIFVKDSSSAGLRMGAKA